MAQARTLGNEELLQLLDYVGTRAHAARNRAMLLLTHLAGLRVSEVAYLRWSDVTVEDGTVRNEVRLLADMTKNGVARTVYVSSKLRAELQAYADQARCINRNYPFFYSQKSFKTGFSANSLTQTFALMYAGAGMEGATSHTGRRTFLTKLANQNTPIHLLKTLAGHKSISTTATYLYSNPTLLKAAVELA